MGFPDGSVVKNPPANARDTRVRVRPLGRNNPLEEGMATHSNMLAWKIPWTEEPGRLQSMGSQRVRHDWSDLAAAEVTNLDSLVLRRWRLCLQFRRHGFYPWDGKISWRREWQLRPVFLPGEFPGQRSLVGYSPWSHKEMDRTEWLTHFTSTQES